MLNALGLIGAAIEARENWAFVVSVNDIGIARVHGDGAAFTAAHGVPVGAIDEAVVAARSNADGRVVLLGAINTIEKISVGSNVIELRGGLVVQGGPIFSAIHGDGCAAIVAVDHAIGIVGIDP